MFLKFYVLIDYERNFGLSKNNILCIKLRVQSVIFSFRKYLNKTIKRKQKPTCGYGELSKKCLS